MAEQEEKKVEEPKAVEPTFELKDYSPSVQAELKNLANIELLLKRVKGIEGDEAFAYVGARQYVANKAAMIQAAEVARLKAVKAKEALAAPPKKEEKAPELPAPVEPSATE